MCEKAALEAKQELPSLDMKEVIRTRIFYQVNIVTEKKKRLNIISDLVGILYCERDACE